MSLTEAVLLVVGGIAAGTVNSIAGGGSLLTVPLLVLIGLPGGDANGTNRIGVLLSNVTATRTFSRAGAGTWRDALPVLVPVVTGSIIGALVVSQLADDTVERAFGVVMLPILAISLRGATRSTPSPRTLPRWAAAAVLFGIGLYGGAFQAGVGVLLLLALANLGMPLVRANAVKVIVVLVLTVVALPVFIAAGQVDWGPGLVLGAGFATGGWLGARLAIGNGDRLIRPLMVVAVLALAGQMLGLY